MAHLIENMAYVGQTPWHGLGNQLPAQQPIEVWADRAGMNWTIEEAPVQYVVRQVGSLTEICSFDDQKVLFRSDNHAPLSVVGSRYHVVQPREVLEFYRDLTEVSGFELETAGVLKSGKKFWALARTGQETVLKGSDVVKGYLLLATSCDGTLATTATPTTVRVVCNNTLSIALNGASTAIKVPHNTSFDALAVKRQLGIAVTQWDGFMYRMRTLAERKVKSHEAMNFFLKVLCQAPDDAALGLTNERALKKVQAIYDGQGRGAELAAATGKQAADVAVLICGQDLQIHRIERDEALIGQLIELERRFWHLVETDQAPPADGSESAATALQCLYPRDTGQVVDLREDAALSGSFDELLRLRELMAAHGQREAQLKQGIQQRMGEASKAIFPAGEVSWKRSKDGTTLDVDRLTHEQPDLVATYAMTKPGSRRFLIQTGTSSRRAA